MRSKALFKARLTQLEACHLVKYSLSYDVQQPAARSSFRPARMALPIGDPSLATRYGAKIRDEDTSPRGPGSEASVSTLQRPVDSRCVSQSGLSIAPCPPGWSQSPWRKLTAEESCTGVHPNLGDIVWHKGREGVVVNSDWLEGEKGADPKISVQFLEDAPVDLKIEEVEDVEILSVRERQQSHQSASTSAKPPSEAFAWLAGGDAATATCTEVRVPRGAVPHILGKNGRIIKAIEEFTGVLVGIRDLDKSHALVSLFGPPAAIPRAEMIVGCLSRGISSILRRLGIC